MILLRLVSVYLDNTGNRHQGQLGNYRIIHELYHLHAYLTLEEGLNRFKGNFQRLSLGQMFYKNNIK